MRAANDAQAEQQGQSKQSQAKQHSKYPAPGLAKRRFHCFGVLIGTELLGRLRVLRDGAVLRPLDFLVDARLLDHSGGLSNSSRRGCVPLVAVVGIGADSGISCPVLVDGRRGGSDELRRLARDDLIGDVFQPGGRIGVAVVILVDHCFWAFLEVGGELRGIAG